MLSRLIARAPERFQPWARRSLIVATVLFVAFEISRLAALGAFLIPIWQGFGPDIVRWTQRPLWEVLVIFSIAALAFAIPFAGVGYGLLAIKRRLSR